MSETSALAAWESFYVIVGSSSAALTGLMFVVVSLIPESRLRANTTDDGLAAFAAPTVSHFVAGLLLSALLSAPWHSVTRAGELVALGGLAGALYCLIVFRRMRRQRDYQPVHEDWLWYLTLPLFAYAGLLVSGLAVRGWPEPALFAIGAGVLLLVCIGIRNAWDMVTFAVRERTGP